MKWRTGTALFLFFCFFFDIQILWACNTLRRHDDQTSSERELTEERRSKNTSMTGMLVTFKVTHHARGCSQDILITQVIMTLPAPRRVATLHRTKILFSLLQFKLQFPYSIAKTVITTYAMGWNSDGNTRYDTVTILCKRFRDHGYLWENHLWHITLFFYVKLRQTVYTIQSHTHTHTRILHKDQLQAEFKEKMQIVPRWNEVCHLSLCNTKNITKWHTNIKILTISNLTPTITR